MMKCDQGSTSACGKSCCCWSCAEKGTCADVCDAYISEQEVLDHCPSVITEENALATFETRAVGVIQAMANLLKQKKELEEQEKTVREQLVEAMESHGVKSFESDLLKVTFKAASTRAGVDSKALKEKFPEVYEAVKTVTPVKASVSISLK